MKSSTHNGRRLSLRGRWRIEGIWSPLQNLRVMVFINLADGAEFFLQFFSVEWKS